MNLVVDPAVTIVYHRSRSTNESLESPSTGAESEGSQGTARAGHVVKKACRNLAARSRLALFAT